jgi:hypothetical protein
VGRLVVVVLSREIEVGAVTGADAGLGGNDDADATAAAAVVVDTTDCGGAGSTVEGTSELSIGLVELSIGVVELRMAVAYGDRSVCAGVEAVLYA